MKITDPSKIFFTSDTHFGHARIIEYTSRPFPRGVEEMDEVMVERWNEVVPKEGIVFHLGDFSFHSSRRYREIASSLHGRKILVLGNHDHRTLKKDAWSEIYPLLRLQVGIDSQEVWLSHFPFRAWNGWNLHGHLHSGPSGISPYPFQLDVGVDGHDFRPWSWTEVVEKIKRRQENLIS